MPFYQIRPVIVNALQWTEENTQEFLDHMKVPEGQRRVGFTKVPGSPYTPEIFKITEDGAVYFRIGDWAVWEGDELYKYSNDSFEENFVKL